MYKFSYKGTGIIKSKLNSTKGNLQPLTNPSFPQKVKQSVTKHLDLDFHQDY